MELIHQKYLKGYIWYDDLQRIETFMFPRDGLRELILNSAQHKSYDQHVPIQISVYPNQIYIWNIGELPNAIPVERIYEKHPSLPRNPHVASTFFKTGMVECWGRGYKKVAEACLDAGIELPSVKAGFGGLMVHITESEQHEQLRLASDNSGGQSDGINGGQSDGIKSGLSEREIAVLTAVEMPFNIPSMV